jgi:DNA-binding CsgD family transcriptional regulator
MVLAGPAGSGKSRLAAEALRGIPHITITCTPAGSAVSLGAFAPLFPGGVLAPQPPAGQGTPAPHSSGPGTPVPQITGHGPLALGGHGTFPTQSPGHGALAPQSPGHGTLSPQSLRRDSLVRPFTDDGVLGRAAEVLRHGCLLVDDGHLLDDASARLIHHLVVHRQSRLLVIIHADREVPDTLAKLWRDDLLPRLDLHPLRATGVVEVLTETLGGHVEALTARRLHRMSQGNPRLLRELVIATRAAGALTRVTGIWTWRGDPPMTGRLRELVETEIGHVDEAERDAMEVLAFNGSVVPEAMPVSLGVLERLEARGLVTTDDGSAIRLAHPLYGPAVRAGVGRLRASRLPRSPRLSADVAAALAAECADLTERAYAGRLSDVPISFGERLAEDGAALGEPMMTAFCARRAWIARLRGELREAIAWSQEGLRRSPHDSACLAELTQAAACMGDLATAEQAMTGCPSNAPARTWVLAARGDLDGAIKAALDGIGPDLPTPQSAPAAARNELFALHDVVRLGAPELVTDRLARLAGGLDGDLAPLLARHAAAFSTRDGAALDKVARRLSELGLLLHAAEAAAHAASVHNDARSARASRNLASTLARACQNACTPALVGLAMPQLTTRQRQIICLAAAGLTNRQIAERLRLSIRTVANHLYSAYGRLGSSDRAALGRLLTLG